MIEDDDMSRRKDESLLILGIYIFDILGSQHTGHNDSTNSLTKCDIIHVAMD
jgi:hypothetical protein